MNCLVCLRPTTAGGYHERCLRSLFSTRTPPTIDLDLARFQSVALATVGRSTVSGVQRKISVGLRADRQTLTIVESDARYILKPPSAQYPGLPANEHLTMRLADLFGLPTPANGLVHLADGELAYAVRRFDRPPEGGKRRQEDFCQLAGKPAKAKYEGSAELLVRLVRTYSAEPLADLARLFEMLVFAWWTGNEDAHLKNFSLLADPAGRHLLSPVYDQVSTRLYYPDSGFALGVGGKDRRLRRPLWERFMAYAGVPARYGGLVLDRPTRMLSRAEDLVQRSHLPDDLKDRYLAVLTSGANEISG